MRIWIIFGTRKNWTIWRIVSFPLFFPPVYFARQLLRSEELAGFKRNVPRYKGGRRRPSRPSLSPSSSPSPVSATEEETPKVTEVEVEEEKAREQAVEWIEVNPLDTERRSLEVRKRRNRRF